MSIASMCVHTVTVKVEAETRGVSGGAEFGAYAVVATKKCRIMPGVANVFRQLSKEGMEISHTLYFPEDPAVDERNIIFYGTRRFEVLGSKNTDELDRLWVVACKEKGHEVD